MCFILQDYLSFPGIKTNFESHDVIKIKENSSHFPVLARIQINENDDDDDDDEDDLQNEKRNPLYEYENNNEMKSESDNDLFDDRDIADIIGFCILMPTGDVIELDSTGNDTIAKPGK